MTCYNAELPIGPPGPTGPLGPQGPPGTTLGYKVYTALLTQSGETAPTAIVLENTLGFVPAYSRDAAGKYFITYTSGFPINKTFSIINSYIIESDGIPYSVLGFEFIPSSNRLKIESYESTGNFIRN